MTPTVSVTIAAIGPPALVSKTSVTIPVGGIVQVATTAIDAQGNPSGHHVKITSADLTVAKPSAYNTLGVAPVGIVGVGPGVVTISAVAGDNAAATATLTVTVK